MAYKSIKSGHPWWQPFGGEKGFEVWLSKLELDLTLCEYHFNIATIPWIEVLCFHVINGSILLHVGEGHLNVKEQCQCCLTTSPGIFDELFHTIKCIRHRSSCLSSELVVGEKVVGFALVC